jgi:uncharacterized membrane protein YgcG
MRSGSATSARARSAYRAATPSANIAKGATFTGATPIVSRSACNAMISFAWMGTRRSTARRAMICSGTNCAEFVPGIEYYRYNHESYEPPPPSCSVCGTWSCCEPGCAPTLTCHHCDHGFCLPGVPRRALGAAGCGGGGGCGGGSGRNGGCGGGCGGGGSSGWAAAVDGWE